MPQQRGNHKVAGGHDDGVRGRRFGRGLAGDGVQVRHGVSGTGGAGPEAVHHLLGEETARGMHLIG